MLNNAAFLEAKDMDLAFAHGHIVSCHDASTHKCEIYIRTSCLGTHIHNVVDIPISFALLLPSAVFVRVITGGFKM